MASTQSNVNMSQGSRPLVQHQQGDVHQQQHQVQQGQQLVGQQQQPVMKIPGESGESVTVQSQLATSTIEGPSVSSHSNLSQVVQDLSAVHAAHSGWIDSETKRINDAGAAEIHRSLSGAKQLEEQLSRQALEKQRLIEEEHKVSLTKLVQELDLKKSAQLKELQDGLQRQIQSALNTSKADISRIETDMNNKKMELMKQAQLRSGKEIDKLSNLVVETQLKPSVTRTVIETNTGVGHVLAVATGGQISSGSATAESINSQRIEAVPVAGKLEQATDVRTGDMIQRDTGAKVGSGAIVNTMTDVRERHVDGSNLHQQQSINPSSSSAASSSTGPRFHNDGEASAYQTHTDNQSVHSTHNTASHDVNRDSTGKHIDAAYGKPLTHTSDPAYNKHAATTEPQHHTSLLGKVKEALTGHSGEPKSSDATRHH